MTELSLPYGKTYLKAVIPDRWQIESIAPGEVAPAQDPIAVVDAALRHPVDGEGLNSFAGVRSVAVAINDKTRPVPHQHLLPPLLEHLHALGLPDEAITFLIATGTHPVMPPEEYAMILPKEIISRYRILCHDAEDKSSLTYLGQTERGTPVYVNRHYLEADLRIVVGNVEPHQFAGFSGGVKTAAIGLAGKETINHNHAMMTQPEAQIGRYDGNPPRLDVEEIGQMIRVDFALNALLNGEKAIVEAFAGSPVAVMHSAIPRVRQIFQVGVRQPFDLLLVSPGGHPKDINVYQAQKALGHAILVMRPGGTVILAAACPEGTGSQSYESWISDAAMTTHEAVFERFAKEGFRVGPHKAYQISRDASQVRVLLISEMDAAFVKKLLLNSMPGLQEALDLALQDLPEKARIGIMPAANATIPTLL